MYKRWSIAFLKTLIALGILGTFFYHFDFTKIISCMEHVNPTYLALVFLLLIFQLFVASYRWIQLIRLAGFSPPFVKFMSFFSSSTFVNSIVPGGISGDAMRIWFKIKSGIPSGTAFQIALLDRIFTLVGLGFLVGASSLLRVFLMHKPFALMDIIALSISCTTILMVIALVMVEPMVRRYSIKFPSLLQPLNSLSQLMGLMLRNHKPMLALGGIVLLGHFMLVLSVVVLAWGMHIPISLENAFIGIPTALLLSSIPITPGGWGLREGAMVLVLGEFQVMAESAIAVSILFGILSLCATLPGAIVWLLMGKREER